MRWTIFRKLFVSLLLISSIMMVGMALLINNSFQNGLQSYLNQSEVEKVETMAICCLLYYIVSFICLKCFWIILNSSLLCRSNFEVSSLTLQIKINIQLPVCHVQFADHYFRLKLSYGFAASFLVYETILKLFLLLSRQLFLPYNSLLLLMAIFKFNISNYQIFSRLI